MLDLMYFQVLCLKYLAKFTMINIVIYILMLIFHLKDEPICNKIERILSLKELTDSNKKNHKNIRLDDILKYSIEKIFDKNNKQMVAKYEFRIKNIVFDDYGVYSCNIKNSHGSSEYIFEVKAMCM